MNIAQRQEIERKVVRHLMRTMKAHGWEVSRIDNGGDDEDDVIEPNETLAMEEVFAVDEAYIYFRKQFGTRGCTHYARIILGNDGYDAIADHSCGRQHPMDDFEKVMTEGVNPYLDQLEAEYAA